MLNIGKHPEWSQHDEIVNIAKAAFALYSQGEGGRIKAIRYIRQSTSCGLREALEAYDNVCSEVKAKMDGLDINSIPRDRLILIFGLPTPHPELRVRYKNPSWFTAYWSYPDSCFCINGSDWLGPFIDKPLKWMEIPSVD